jgi:putative restriction endonuclease
MSKDKSSIFWVGVTDNNWYSYLKQLQPEPDEVNFWKPSGGSFNALMPGALYLFKLHSPYNYIAGGGFFVRYSRLPLSLAWEAFDQKNGAKDFPGFRALILKRNKTKDLDPEIGCAILSRPFFFNQADWIPMKGEWGSGIMVGKQYDYTEPDGQRLWGQVRERLQSLSLLIEADAFQPQRHQVSLEKPKFGAPTLVRPRLGQGGFRIEVTEAYSRRCAMTGERTLPVLHAAHIRPYTQQGPHDTRNGLLLRSDLHTLFDLGYMTITPDLRIQVSSRIRQEYENGHDYYALQDKPLKIVPTRPIDLPSPEYIEWHNNNIYRP